MRLLLIALLLQACLIPDSLIRDVIDRDNDGEKALGYNGEFGVGTDCDDRNARVGATLPELCDDGLDNNCDGLIDGPTAPNTGTRWYEDRDGDGYGSVILPTWSCTKPPGPFYATAGDCDDRNANANPGAREACNGFDDDCDALVDEDGDLVRWYADNDGDGHGDPHTWVQACQRPAGYLQSGTDCDDHAPTVHPSAPEVWYDGLDADCAGGDDFDQDGDGARHASAFAGAPPPEALVDCDDTNNRIYPGAPELWYDGADQDCDPRTEWDQDNDGYTRANAPTAPPTTATTSAC